MTEISSPPQVPQGQYVHMNSREIAFREQISARQLHIQVGQSYDTDFV
jgi:hypothetical protein